ncbi:hypothetical protein N0V90_000862 [Kalmusia sp. IMI 367209]|nr:hypothetical protein N0V90_000862 [Kalmusia sp. IMI 367209]
MVYIWQVFISLRRRLAVFLLRTVFNLLHISAVRRDQQLAGQILGTYGASVQTVYIPSRDKSRKIKAHFYTPPSEPKSSKSPRPVLVNTHGSGFTIPFHGSDAAFCARVAKEVGAYVIDTDYRKAPEDPFPAALEDVKDVLDWVATQPERFDASHVAVSGASAGGNLALIASSTLRKSLKVDIKAVVASYPVADLSLRAEDRVIPNPVQPLPPPVLDLFYSGYVPDEAMRKDPLVSPIYARTEDYPSTMVVIACEGDTLSGEAKRLVEKVDDGSRKVVKCYLEGMNHGYDVGAQRGTKKWYSREKAHALAIEALRESLRKA